MLAVKYCGRPLLVHIKSTYIYGVKNINSSRQIYLYLIRYLTGICHLVRYYVPSLFLEFTVS